MCHTGVTHLLKTCYGTMIAPLADVTLQDEVEIQPPSYTFDRLYPCYGGVSDLSIQVDQSFAGAI